MRAAGPARTWPQAWHKVGKNRCRAVTCTQSLAPRVALGDPPGRAAHSGELSWEAADCPPGALAATPPGCVVLGQSLLSVAKVKKNCATCWARYATSHQKISTDWLANIITVFFGQSTN